MRDFDDSSASGDDGREPAGRPPPKEKFENAAIQVVAGPTFAAAEAAVEDLSRALVEMLPRGRGETVKCRRIRGDHYRCNWWGIRDAAGYDNPGMGGLLVTTHRVIRSEVVRARRTAEGLVVESGRRQ